MFIRKSCEQGCARGALAVGLLAFLSSGGARGEQRERERRELPGCFVFGGICAADENKRFAPGPVPFVVPQVQGREELLKHLPATALLC